MAKATMAVLDIAIFCVASVFATAAFPQTAYAYVDPSIMTYTIQAVASVSVALSAVIGVAWRKAKRRLIRLFNIDENADKTGDPSVFLIERTDQASLEKADGLALEQKLLAQKYLKSGRPLKWQNRTLRSFVIALFFVFSVYVFPACDLVTSSGASLTFGLAYMWFPVVISGAIAILILTAFLSSLKGRIFDVSIAIFASLGFAGFAQMLFLNSGLPLADGNAIVWADYHAKMIASGILWLAIISIVAALAILKPRSTRNVLATLCSILAVIQFIGVAGLCLTAEGPAKTVTEDGLYEVSPNSNVVVFCLDTIDSQDIERILGSHPETFADLEGFTYYRNSVGSMIPTRYGVSFLLTGSLPEEGQHFSDYIETRYDQSSFVSDIYNAGYDIGIYSNSLYNGVSDIGDMTINIHVPDGTTIDYIGSVKAMVKCAGYRSMPWILKPYFWFTTYEINSSCAAVSKQGESRDSSYTTNDPAYYSALLEKGLSLTSGDSAGAFRFIHLAGSHEPYTMNEECVFTPSGTTVDQQIRGSFGIVSEYISQLKELGVYDKTTIVITSDHGYWYCTEGALSYPSCAIIFVKPASDGSNNQLMQISDAPVSHVDIHPTIIDAIGKDYSSYEGYSLISESIDSQRERLYYMTSSNGHNDTYVREYAITGSSLDFESWSLTKREWELNKTYTDVY